MSAGRPAFSPPRRVAIVGKKRMAKGRNDMQGPEDDAGLAGKVALISGGGAAGDGIGNGRAAAILLARAGADNEPAYKEVLQQYPIPGVN
jgi:hypothetical protein